ncbi:MAG: hypothetical protein RIF46_01030, partial [Cyclobacteriaceae bacterium]
VYSLKEGGASVVYLNDDFVPVTAKQILYKDEKFFSASIIKNNLSVLFSGHSEKENRFHLGVKTFNLTTGLLSSQIVDQGYYHHSEFSWFEFNDDDSYDNFYYTKKAKEPSTYYLYKRILTEDFKTVSLDSLEFSKFIFPPARGSRLYSDIIVGSNQVYCLENYAWRNKNEFSISSNDSLQYFKLDIEDYGILSLVPWTDSGNDTAKFIGTYGEVKMERSWVKGYLSFELSLNDGQVSNFKKFPLEMDFLEDYVGTPNKYTKKLIKDQIMYPMTETFLRETTDNDRIMISKVNRATWDLVAIKISDQGEVKWIKPIKAQPHVVSGPDAYQDFLSVYGQVEHSFHPKNDATIILSNASNGKDKNGAINLTVLTNGGEINSQILRDNSFQTPAVLWHNKTWDLPDGSILIFTSDQKNHRIQQFMKISTSRSGVPSENKN